MIKTTLNSAVLALALLSTANSVQATSLTGALTADDAFTVYLSTNDAIAGSALANSFNWGSVQSFSTLLAPATQYFLHVAAKDLYGAPSAFLGSFDLTDSDFQFANGTQTLSSNISDWKVSSTGFGSSPFSPVSLGTNGVSPWGPMGAIAPDANWIWSGPSGSVGEAYFSTTITSAVPEPETYALLLAGLAFVGTITRIRKSGKQSNGTV